MHRGKALQPEKECEFCNKPLPALRHPNAKYCDTICRGRDRYAREHNSKGIKCLDCGKYFDRVGSHVVQVHGYSNVIEYRREHGLMAKETHTIEHANKMRAKLADKSLDNLEKGEDNRFVKGGDHADRLKEFWDNRKAKKGYLGNNTPLGG